ncbi:MAG: sugar porter family MFS transporter [Gammaproteobacteria bacterium]|nr:sugar porter family MFS transporter [Gammaproteobacteria bacterium]MCH9743973.1 sugar porter family MFS transporter [Gammaproteobacteria bacterium]
MSQASSRQKWWVFAVSLLVGVGGILYGYDIGVVSGALLFIHKSIPMTSTQTGLTVGAVLAGSLVGTLCAGPCADQFGRKAVIALSSVVFMIGVFFIVSAESFMSLLIARLFLGVGVGIVSVAVPLYVTEIVPSKDRGKYVTFFQLFLTFGIVMAYFVDLAFTPSGNWRGMFEVVLIPAFILLVGCCYLPESPRWLIAHKNSRKAWGILTKTHSKEQAEIEFREIHESLTKSEGTWKELLSNKLMLPLCIAVGVAICNQWTGINSFLQYAPSILKQAGLGSNVAVMLGSAGIGMLNFICTIVAIFLVDRIGRRPLLIFGVAGIIISEVYLGYINHMAMGSHALGMMSLMGLFAFIISYGIGPGVVVWLAISELFPTRVRGKGIAFCLFFNSLAGSLLASVFLDINKEMGISGAYWLCACFSVIYFLIAYFLLPETKEKSLEEIQQHFEDQKASANLTGNLTTQ